MDNALNRLNRLAEGDHSAVPHNGADILMTYWDENENGTVSHTLDGLNGRQITAEEIAAINPKIHIIIEYVSEGM